MSLDCRRSPFDSGLGDGVFVSLFFLSLFRPFFFYAAVLGISTLSQVSSKG
jgi:hypothetical protein